MSEELTGVNMTYWTTKPSTNKTNKEYVVVKHKLRGFNGRIHGVRFRDSYAVVIENSKLHSLLKRTSFLSKENPLPLLHLSKLKFITNVKDINTVYGKDVYVEFLKQKNEHVKVLETEKQEKEKKKTEIIKEDHFKSNLCRFKTPSGNFCKNEAIQNTPSRYCKLHLLKDPLLVNFGIVVPKFIPKNKKQEVRQTVLKKLQTVKIDKGS